MKTLQYKSLAKKMRLRGPTDRDHHEILNGSVLTPVFSSTSGLWCIVTTVMFSASDF